MRITPTLYRQIPRLFIAAGLACLAVFLLAACGDTPTLEPAPTPTSAVVAPETSYDFRNGAQGWVAGFSDYPSGQEQSYQLDSGIRALPAGIEPTGTGYFITGNNHSDDLFMFLKRKIGASEGVKPNTAYHLKFKIVFVSNAPSGCTGIGGAPGEAVTLKAGASDIEPLPIVKDAAYRMNVDKGEQTNGGPAGGVVSDIANGKPCDSSQGDNAPYISLSKTYATELSLSVKSTATGDLWVLIGTDSGYEGITALYYQQVVVKWIPVTAK